MLDLTSCYLNGYNLIDKSNRCILSGQYIPDCCGAIDVDQMIPMSKEELIETLKTLDRKLYECTKYYDDSHNSALLIINTELDMTDLLHPIAKNLWAYEREHLYIYDYSDDRDEYDEYDD